MDSVLSYILSTGKRQKKDVLDGISRFVADYPNQAVEPEKGDAVRLNGITGRTRRIVTQAYEVGSELNRRQGMMIQAYHDKISAKWMRFCLGSVVVALSLGVLLGWLAGGNLKKEVSPVVVAQKEETAKWQKTSKQKVSTFMQERMRLEGAQRKSQTR